MASIRNSAHIVPLGDGKFRLTFVSATPGGATFSSELGDVELCRLRDWLKDHVHPAEDSDALLSGVSAQSELEIPLGIMLSSYQWDEEGMMVRSPATQEEICQWLCDYQIGCFGDGKVGLSVALANAADLKATAGFCPGHPGNGFLLLCRELLGFNSALRISMLHELIHANLFLENGDADGEHGPRFQSQISRLIEMGIYQPLL